MKIPTLAELRQAGPRKAARMLRAAEQEIRAALAERRGTSHARRLCGLLGNIGKRRRALERT